MASIHTHPKSPFWMAHFYEDGKRTTKSTRVKANEAGKERAQQLADAWEQAAVIAGDGRDGRAWALATINEIFARGGVPLVQEKCETWESVVAAFLVNLRTRRKPSTSTVAGYITGLKVFGEWLGARARKDIRSISPKIIDAYVTHLQDRYATSTVEIRLTQISSVFAWAIRQEMVDRNPATKVDRPQSVAIQRTPFTAAEIVTLIQTAQAEQVSGQENSGELLTLLLFGVCTGARLMDCARMRWDQVDLDARVLSYIPQKTAKKGQVLRVAIADPLLSYLRGLKRCSEWILPRFHKHQGPVLSTRFMAFLRRAGIESERTTEGRARAHNSKSFHGLRHTLATLLQEGGVDELVRRRITGHEDKAVAAIYAHVSVEATGLALARVLRPIQ